MDYLILYEEKVRELENACLLKKGLEKKGHTVAIYSIYSLKKHFINAKVVIVPHLYDNYQVYEFLCKYKKRTCKVINLQYEQVLSDNDKNIGYAMPRGEAKNGIVFAWGESEKNRYLDVPHQKVIETGCLSMDFNLKKYDQYFLGENEIREKYCLEYNKKMILYISSFALANKTTDEIKLHYPNNWEEISLFATISRKSKKSTLQILEKLALEDEYMVIYRPHPAEYEDKELCKISKSIKNFHVIRDFSIRQWIRVCDYLVTWFSTSIVDIYYSQKPCVILRPEKIPAHLDVPFLVNARCVTNYESLVHELNSPLSFPVNEKEIKKYYSNAVGEEVLSKYVKACSDVYRSSDCIHTFCYRQSNMRLINKFRSFVADFMFDLSVSFDLSKLYSFIFRDDNYKRNYYNHIQKELYQSKKLIKDYNKRLRNVE